MIDPNGTGLVRGQLVALNPIIKCGECENCRKGQENLCDRKRFPGSATTVPHIDGFFQAEFDFPATCCHVVPDGVEPDHLTFAEPLACAMHAVTVSQAARGTRVLVTGCGPMGLLAIVAAKAAGASVAASDVRAEALTLAAEIGAGAVYRAGQDEIPSSAYDVAIEASGAPQAFNQALEAVRRQGRLSILSNIQPSATPIYLHRIMLKEISVAGSFQFNMEFVKAIDLIASEAHVIDRLVAKRFPLEDTAAALDAALSGAIPGKVLLKPST